jgi:D-glycero-D-manno-heptose 1,7-bisphosphate phosphatase
MKVLFLDRDGIVNVERGAYTYLKQDFSFTKNLIDFLSLFKNEGFEIIVITNQGGIDKGLYNKKDVEALHSWMVKEIKSYGIDVLDIYYCPHHDIVQQCLCRKPKSLLFEKSVARFGIDTSKSIMIGDNKRDIDAAKKLGIKGFLVGSNPDWKDIHTAEMLA